VTSAGADDTRRLSVQYPGGIAARYRWTGTGGGPQMFAISEAIGELTDHGALVGPEPDRMCRLELRVESPVGGWTARFASPIYDEPRGALWDEAGLLLVAYGFVVYALEPRAGALAWAHTTGTPIVAILASSRLDHVVLQTEIETIALRRNGEVAWRAAHSEVVVDAALIAGRLDLTTYTGAHLYVDAASGRAS